MIKLTHSNTDAKLQWLLGSEWPLDLGHELLGSNPTRGMDGCVYRYKKLKKGAKAKQWAIESFIKKNSMV
jgi:hypothetical protein